MINEKKDIRPKIDLRESIHYSEEEARKFCKTLTTTELIKEFYRLKSKLKFNTDGLYFIMEEMKERMVKK